MHRYKLYEEKIEGSRRTQYYICEKCTVIKIVALNKKGEVTAEEFCDTGKIQTTSLSKHWIKEEPGCVESFVKPIIKGARIKGVF